MGKAWLAAAVTIVIGCPGMAVGFEFMGGFSELGLLAAVAVMGGFIICFNEAKNDSTIKKENYFKEVVT